MKNRFLTAEKVQVLLQQLRANKLLGTYDQERHSIFIGENENRELGRLRLPIHFSNPDVEGSYRNYIIILVQSGSASVGYLQGGNLISHKVFKSYMVRMKQGTSQIKYLKTKGKSKAGSRVRLGNSKDFFEDINERLQEIFEEYPVDCIAFSCSKILLPFFFNSAVQCPFSKDDERILKIPRHVESPNFEELLAVQKYLQMGELQMTEYGQEILDEMLQ